MKTSCGILIVNEFEELFMGHSTGNKFYDIPKGELDEGESVIDCALRETIEETSIDLRDKKLLDLGLFKYNSAKNLHLFLVFLPKDEIKLDKLVCNSYFEDYYTKVLKPEVDEFRWVKTESLESFCAKSMGKVLTKLVSDGVLKYQEQIEEMNKNKLKS